MQVFCYKDWEYLSRPIYWIGKLFKTRKTQNNISFVFIEKIGWFLLAPTKYFLKNIKKQNAYLWNKGILVHTPNLTHIDGRKYVAIVALKKLCHRKRFISQPNANVIDLVQLMLFPEKTRYKDHSHTACTGFDDNEQSAEENISKSSSTNAEHHTIGLKPLADIEIMAHSMTFLLAGYETSGAVLAYFFHELAKHPELQERLLEEINDSIGKVLGVHLC